VAVMQFEELR